MSSSNASSPVRVKGPGKQKKSPPLLEDGSIVWLPLWDKIDIVHQRKIMHLENNGCLNHPVVILSVDAKKTEAIVLVITSQPKYCEKTHPEYRNHLPIRFCSDTIEDPTLPALFLENNEKLEKSSWVKTHVKLQIPAQILTHLWVGKRKLSKRSYRALVKHTGFVRPESHVSQVLVEVSGNASRTELLAGEYDRGASMSGGGITLDKPLPRLPSAEALLPQHSLSLFPESSRRAREQEPLLPIASTPPKVYDYHRELGSSSSREGSDRKGWVGLFLVVVALSTVVAGAVVVLRAPWDVVKIWGSVVADWNVKMEQVIRCSSSL